MSPIYRFLFCVVLSGFLIFGTDFNSDTYTVAHSKKKTPKASSRSKKAQRSEVSAQEGQTLYIKTQSANLRASPTTASDNIIDRLSQETPVTPLRREEGWYLVKLPDGRIGWMAGSVLTPKKEELEERTPPVEKPQPSVRTREEVPRLPQLSEQPQEVTPTPPPMQETKPLQPVIESREVSKTPKGMVFISSGEAIVGSSEEEINRIAQRQGVDVAELVDEKPKRRAFVKSFFIDKYEVTNAQYKKFIDMTGHKSPLHWEENSYATHKRDHPVIYVSWEDAKAYCKWAGKRLPTQEEWEKAARGSEGQLYPWGNEYAGEKVNLVNAGRGDTASVGESKGDISPYGIYDMGGNVSEWTASSYDSDRNSYTLKGGSWYSEIYTARGAHRSLGIPEYQLDIVGFRCAKDK